MHIRARAHSAVVTILIAAAGAGLAGHDFWIEPSTFEPAVDEAVRVHLRIGERFAGESLARNGSLIDKFVVVGPSGEKPVLGRDGMDPAGLLRLDAPGIWFVGYRSKSSAVELAADKFEDYLRAEGLERIIEERATRRERQMPGREKFSRSVKSLLRYGGDRAVQGFDRALGMTLELVLEADPARAAGGRVPVRLVHDGRPLPGALVIAYRKDAGSKDSGNEELRARTDKDGRIVVPVTGGVWLLKSVYMERAAAGSGADWESVWTALTFHVPAS